METKLEVTARALIVHQNKLLLVSNDGSYWYTPGGRVNPSESLTECVEREVYEELGLTVKPVNIHYLFELFDTQQKTHKIECYFKVKVKGNFKLRRWHDQAGPVRKKRLFSRSELSTSKNVLPSFLASGEWAHDKRCIKAIYKGTEII